MNEAETIRFAQSLVRINSVHRNETQVAHLVKEKLRDYGIRPRLVGKNRNRKSLVAVIKGPGKRSLMLNGHLDTVPIGNPSKWKYPPFSGKLVNGKIFGRGSQDMKGGLAALTKTVVDLTESDVTLRGNVILALSADEEENNTGIRELLKNKIRADAALVADSLKQDQPVIGARGIYRFQITTRGKTAHTASIHSEGVNAVTKMAKIVLVLEQAKTRYKKNFFPPPKITPSIIHGGIAINVVPDRCEARVDCRLTLGQTKKTLLEDIRTTIRKLKDNEISYSITETNFLPPYLISKKEQIVQSALRNARKAWKKKGSLAIAGSSSDSNLISGRMPVVVMGTRGKNAHSENEFVYAKSILQMSKVYSNIIRDFLGGNNK